jgi:hypothetical protein
MQRYKKNHRNPNNSGKIFQLFAILTLLRPKEESAMLVAQKWWGSWWG